MGYAQKCPSTNNGAEGYNSHIKRDLTVRELLELGDLHDALFRELHDKSVAYENNEITIPQHIEIPDDLWISARKWMVSDVPSILLDNVTYITSSESIESGNELTREKIDILNNLAAICSFGT